LSRSVPSQQDLALTKAPVDILHQMAAINLYTGVQAELMILNSMHDITLDISQYLFLGVVAGLLP